MRRVLLLLLFALTLSGILLWWVWPAQRVLVLLHIWGGLLFLVICPLYIVSHVGAHRDLLKRLLGVTVSGYLQICSAVLAMLTGVVLVLHQGYAWIWELHVISSALLLGALILHRLTR